MPRLSTAEATVETLLLHGIDTVYALPGLHHDLAFALQRLGRTDEARSHALEANRER